MGRKVGTAVSQRLGRSLLELGGNNADDSGIDVSTWLSAASPLPPWGLPDSDARP